MRTRVIVTIKVASKSLQTNKQGHGLCSTGTTMCLHPFDCITDWDVFSIEIFKITQLAACILPYNLYK